jgi:hypothetical protein
MPALNVFHPLRYWTDFPVCRPELDLQDAVLDREESLSERYAFQVGEDLGIHRLCKDDEFDNEAMRRGYVHGLTRTPRHADIYLRKVLQVRRNAYARSIPVSSAFTVDYLRSITVTVCPVSGVELTQGTQCESDWSVDRLANGLGYVPGNICIVASRVNRFKGAEDHLDLMAEARHILLKEGPSGIAADVGNGLKVIEALRLGALMAAPSAFAERKMGSSAPFAMAPMTWATIDTAIAAMHVGCARSRIEGQAYRMRAQLLKPLGKETWRTSNRLVETLRQLMGKGMHPADAWFDGPVMQLLGDIQAELEANPPSVPESELERCFEDLNNSASAVERYVR